MVGIFDIGIIGIAIVTIVNVLKKKSKKREDNTKILLLILLFFVILKLMFG